jgi:hypothetical protein
LNSVIEFEQKIENKNDLRKRSLIDQERHLALEIPTSKWLTLGRREGEREHTYKIISR